MPRAAQLFCAGSQKQFVAEYRSQLPQSFFTLVFVSALESPP
jgi:hypothetical protein